MKKPKIKLTIVDRVGKCGCHRGHKIGDTFDFDEDRGRLCPMAFHSGFPYIDILRYGGDIQKVKVEITDLLVQMLIQYLYSKLR